MAVVEAVVRPQPMEPDPVVTPDDDTGMEPGPEPLPTPSGNPPTDDPVPGDKEGPGDPNPRTA